MGSFSAQAKVGLIAIVAILMIVAAFSLLEPSYKGQTYKVLFENARGLSKGVEVRIGGVVKGTVDKVYYNFDTKNAVLDIKLKLQKGEFIPKDAVFVASSEGLIGEKVINVEIPKDREGEPADEDHVFVGKWQSGFDDLLVKGNKALEDLSSIIEKAEEVLSKDVLSDPVMRITEGIEETMDQLSQLFSHFDSVVFENADEIKEAMRNVVEMTENFTELSLSLRDKVDDPELKSRLDGILSDIEETTASIRRISENIEEITGDPEVVEGIKTSVKLAEETLKDAKEAIGEFRGTLEKADEKIDDLSEITDIEISGSIAGRYVVNDDPGEGEDENTVLGDVEVKMSTKKGSIHIGVTGIGEESEVSIQVGREVSPNLEFRGGVIRSKIGVGFDYYLGEFRFTADGYDPNDPKLNSYLGLKISDDYSLQVGIEDAFGDAEFVAGIALEF